MAPPARDRFRLFPSPDHRILDEAPALRPFSLRFRDPETERAFQAAARFLLGRVGERASIDVLEVR
jgi:hypothetical protein